MIEDRKNVAFTIGSTVVRNYQLVRDFKNFQVKIKQALVSKTLPPRCICSKSLTLVVKIEKNLQKVCFSFDNEHIKLEGFCEVAELFQSSNGS